MTADLPLIAVELAGHGERAFQTFDEFESWLAQFPPAPMPVTHRFTPGLYIREILIPAGTICTSMEHRTEHPFVVSEGLIEVISATEGRVTYAAPHTGITKPGTRRILHALEDTVWTTFHVTTATDVEKIGEAILVPTSNPGREQWRLSLPTLLPP